MWTVVAGYTKSAVPDRSESQQDKYYRDLQEMLCVRIASLLLAAAALCCMYREARAAVIAIDFGSEWMKTALVKPGVPMEIALNKESKRKTAAAVSMRNGERLFGDAALSMGVKYPKSTYRYLQLLLGQKFDSPLVKKYREWFPFYDMKKDEERGTVLFQHDSDTVFTPEELVGMMLNHSRHMAEEYAGQTIREVVITVPPFFSQAQRRAMLQAAKLVSLNVLQLISNTAAAALNYGLFRQSTFNSTPQYIMYYDMGAAATTATIIEYRLAQVREGPVVNTHPQLVVKGTGFDRTLGGLEMEFRLRDFLAGKFEAMKKTQGSVYDSPRALAKLLKEAKRLKQVLSANTEHFAQIEGLLEDVDFRFKVTREEFEELCSDLFDRVEKPVTQALNAADMTMPEMDAVILVGGGTRVPRVQEALLAATGKTELGKSLNTDEAPALGAVYQGAGHTKLFRVKKFLVKEGNLFPIQVSFTRHSIGDDGEEVAKTVTRTLFQRSNAYPQKKVLTFNRYSNDFAFSVFYGELDFLSEEEKSYLGRVNLTEVYLAGVGEALEEHSRGEPKGIKAHFRMDESGLLQLVNVESIFEYPEAEEEESTFSKISSTLSSFFGGGSSNEPKESEGGASEGDGEKVETQTAAEPEAEQPEGAAQDTSEDGTNESDESDDSDESDESQSLGDQQERTRDQQETDDQEEESHDQEEESRDQEEESQESHDQTEEPHDQEEESHDQAEESDDQQEEELEPPEEGDEEEVEGDGEGEEEEKKGDEEEDERDSNKSENEEQQATEAPANDTTTSDAKPGKKKTAKDKPVTPKGRTVKVNLTAEVTTLDLPSPHPHHLQASADKLRQLQERDDEKAANEAAKNSLEAHVFETQDAMYSEEVVAVTTEEQREVILSALREAADWMDEEGWAAETKVYKEKLRELKRVSRAAFRRVNEAVRRPKAVGILQETLRVSRDFVARMQNLTEELQIFTEVEISTLETLANETEEWLAEKEALQVTTSPHEEPVLLSYEVEEHTKRIDREVMYLLNKLRTHPIPKRAPPSTTNATNSTFTKANVKNATTVEEDTVAMETEEENEEEPETLELPEAEPATEDLPAPEPPESAAEEQMSASAPTSPGSDEHHGEL